MSDYTPTEARVCIDFCNAAVKRRQPDGSFMDMEEADAAFSRWLAAHDEAVRQEERERTINEAQDELVRQDAFTERSLRILDGIRGQK